MLHDDNWLSRHFTTMGMVWRLLVRQYRRWIQVPWVQKTVEYGVAALVGILMGVLLVVARASSTTMLGLVFLIPIGVTAVMLINDLERTVLAAIAISVPLNLDFSVIISPHARNTYNLLHGHHTIVALTELRVSLVTFMLIVGYAIWLTGTTRSGKKKLIHLFGGTSVPILALFLITTLSAMWATDRQLSYFRAEQVFELAVMYLYLANHLTTFDEMMFFIQVFMGAMLAESLLMIWQWLTGAEFWIVGIEAIVYSDPRRVGGTLGGPNIAGGLLAAYAAITSAMIWVFPKAHQKLFALVCFVAGSIALLSTASRSSWAGTVLALAVFSTVGLLRGWVSMEMVGLLVIGAMIIGAIFYPMIHERLTGDDNGSAESREKMAKLAWNMIQANFWFGVGANNYALLARDYYTSDVGYLGYVIDSSVHNRYLLIWAETGLFGLMIYLSFLISPLLTAARYVLSVHREVSLLALGFGGGLMALTLQMFVEHFDTRPSALMVWLLISLIASLRNLEDEAQRESGAVA